MSKINLQRGKLTVENRKSREKKRICSEVSVNSPGNPWNKVSHLRLPCCTINLTHGISDILLDVQNMGKMVKRQPVSEMALFLSGRKKGSPYSLTE